MSIAGEAAKIIETAVTPEVPDAHEVGASETATKGAAAMLAWELAPDYAAQFTGPAVAVGRITGMSEGTAPYMGPIVTSIK